MQLLADRAAAGPAKGDQFASSQDYASANAYSEASEVTMLICCLKLKP